MQEGHALLALFIDWVKAESYVISDTSPNFYEDYSWLLRKAEKRAAALKIPPEMTEHLLRDLVETVESCRPVDYL